MAHRPLWIVPLVLLAAWASETAQPEVCDDAVDDEVAALQLKADHNSSIFDTHYVFVEYHGLPGGFHSETMICPIAKFSRTDQLYLSSAKFAKPGGFKANMIPDEWWKSWDIACTEIAYGGSAGCSPFASSSSASSRSNSECSEKPCSGVEFDTSGKRKISKTDTENAGGIIKGPWKYFYGKTNKEKATMKQDVCGGGIMKKGEQWTSYAYSLLSNNCNRFTATLLKCSLGLDYTMPADIWMMGYGTWTFAGLTC
ncbi:unnamed protein product [Polarella glacialis]|uniref:Uncharacterized protein n=1 Tax=Polarella glacialis TaxID=89957 RepID=A0A813D2P3_POLGL|nr:unnamed protein product [Polarella glacialis]CAE8707662.1 unnamed protein product [Polarella glacialis]